jgi:uncharacterized protein YbgA (DUF1722 family)
MSKELQRNEKELFLKSLDDYAHRLVSLEVPIALMKSWIIRFEEPYLREQSYFEPYPLELHDAESIQVCPSKDYWKK